MKRLVLLDTNHLMHRAYWAIQRSLSTSTGEQTNAIFGVVSMLLTLLSREHPDLVIACFDTGKETFRHQDHKEYKAGRVETPNDFYLQVPRIHECLAAFSIPIFSDAMYEADDLLGALARRGVDEGYDVIIVTGDRDLYQMASDRIRIAIPHKGYAMPEYLDAGGVEQKLGIRPMQVPDYKGLTGDPSDNLRGVRGIGPKTAVELLRAYGSLEGVYEHLEEIRGSVQAKLAADRESAFLCKKLATLVTDIPLTRDLPSLVPWRADVHAIDHFFTVMEFHTLRRRFRKFLEEVSYAREHFAGDAVVLPLEEHLTTEEGRMTEAQLPLLD